MYYINKSSLLCVAGHLSAPARIFGETWSRRISWRSSHDVKLPWLISRVARSTLPRGCPPTHSTPKKHFQPHLLYLSPSFLCRALLPHVGQLVDPLVAGLGWTPSTQSLDWTHYSRPTAPCVDPVLDRPCRCQHVYLRCLGWRNDLGTEAFYPVLLRACDGATRRRTAWMTAPFRNLSRLHFCLSGHLGAA
ncbi:uncharacterized protein J3D65DRAFT_403660 [Phyllosticta citribraziliensis]|uniref:Uncharacterized protein n=1 Tax=Phyllosticta citribraziliensis TaxID=989973 RepID=A0ABR1LMZ5_9PEZI